MTFRILQEQMQALGRTTSVRFIAMMADYLRDNFPNWTKGLAADEMLQWLETALKKAAHYGITSEPEAAQFMLLLTVVGLDADERLPWVRPLLEDNTLAESGKVRKFIAACRTHAVPVEPVLVYDDVPTAI